MTQTWPIRLLIALAGLALCAFFITPTAVYFGLDEDQTAEVRANKGAFAQYIPSWSPESHIVPGLDLQGGIHMVLGVDLDKAISDRAGRTAGRLRSLTEDNEIATKQIDHLRDEGKGDQVRVVFADSAAKAKFKDEVLDQYFDTLVIKSDEGDSMVFAISPEYRTKLEGEAVSQTITTLNNRIDKMGVTEPSISRRGDDQVQIQLPGYDDPEEAKSLIGRTAQLEFQMCDDETDFLTKITDLPEWASLQTTSYGREDGGTGNDIFLLFPEANWEDMKTFLKGKVPSGNIVKYKRINSSTGGTGQIRSYTLKSQIELTGEDLVDARVQPGSADNPRPSVSLDFSPAGGKLFGELSSNNVGNRMAIVLEDLIDSAPVFNGPILGGSAQITMGSGNTQQMTRDAQQLATVLKSGALPAPVQFREERSVGPSLGKIAVQHGKTAFFWGGLLVMLFMLIYYRLAGFISVIGIVFNLAMMAAVMSWLGATVTLPGLAGLLLTVGMAVDANIIIIERIREELRAGKTPRSAVDAGYAHAFSAIIDANVTTFIAGIVLWQFGTGPVQNFATTLLIGTFSSVVSAVFITRIFFDMLVSKNPETISV